MKIAYMSDLHLEHYSNENQILSGQQIDLINNECDVLVLAGDIHKDVQGIKWADEHFVIPVIYVLGNHEFYGQFYEHLLADAHKLSKNSRNVYFLDDQFVYGTNSVVIDNVKFFGSTFWSDFAINGDKNIGKYYAKRGMNDFRIIYMKFEPGFFNVDLAAEMFENTKQSLHNAIENNSEHKMVVVSHHGPHMDANPKKYRGGMLCPAFTFDGSEFFGNVDCWIYGHTHFNNDMEINGTQIVTNQAGYPFEPVEGFNPVKVIEV